MISLIKVYILNELSLYIFYISNMYTINSLYEELYLLYGSVINYHKT